MEEKQPMKKSKKVLIAAAAVISIIAATIILFFTLLMTKGFSVTLHDMKYYDKIRAEYEFMPVIEELGDCKDINLKYRKRIAPFGSEVCTLKVKYKSENYEREKAKVYGNLTASYFPAKSVEYGENNSIIKDGYRFNYIDRGNFPKKIYLIATNDDKKTISYICFFDPDIEYIDSFDEFLKQNCKW